MKLHWKQIAASLLVGCVIGAALGRFAHWRHFGRTSEEQRYSRMVERFSRKLDLDAGQRGKVTAILDAQRRKIEALRSDIRPKFEDIRKSTKSEIRHILTPEQQPKFDKLEAEWSSRWEKRGPGKGAP